jgi:hypothetical protein
MDRNRSDAARRSRGESERFGKDFFRRGKAICSKSGAEMFVSIRRRGKCQRFSTSDSLHLSEGKIVSGA